MTLKKLERYWRVNLLGPDPRFMKKRVALIMLIIALQLDVSTSKLYAVAIWRLLYVSLVVCCDVMARLLTHFLLAGSLYRRNIRRWHVKNPVFSFNTKLHSCLLLAELFLEWEMFYTKFVQKIKTHILCSIILPPKILSFMWENVVQPGRPQMKIQYWACDLHAG